MQVMMRTASSLPASSHILVRSIRQTCFAINSGSTRGRGNKIVVYTGLMDEDFMVLKFPLKVVIDLNKNMDVLLYYEP